MELLVGDLILVKGTDWISHAIEDVEHSPYSHVATYAGDNQVIEAQGFKKTGYQSLDVYKGMADVFRTPATPGQRQEILEYLRKEVGGHYDYLLLGWEFIRYEFHILLPYKEPSTIKICSVLGAAAQRYAGIPLCQGIPYPSPADVALDKYVIKIGSY